MDSLVVTGLRIEQESWRVWEAIQYFSTYDEDKQYPTHYRIVINRVHRVLSGEPLEAYHWGTIAEWRDPVTNRLHRLQIRDYRSEKNWDVQEFTVKIKD